MKLFKLFKKNTVNIELLKEKIQAALDGLAELEIRPIEDDFIEWILLEWGEERVEDDLYSLVLFTLGGEREVEEKWIPLSDDVYTFDTECITGGSDYVWVLERLSAISKGEFSFKDLECIINDEKESVSLSFEYENTKYHWNPVYQFDWFDCDVIMNMNQLLEEKDSEKFFYNSSDDQNMTIIYSSAEVVEKLNQYMVVPFERV